ncbi:hypothetical protein FF1_019532 [Malus domestica]
MQFRDQRRQRIYDDDCVGRGHPRLVGEMTRTTRKNSSHCYTCVGGIPVSPWLLAMDVFTVGQENAECGRSLGGLWLNLARLHARLVHFFIKQSLVDSVWFGTASGATSSRGSNVS